MARSPKQRRPTNPGRAKRGSHDKLAAKYEAARQLALASRFEESRQLYRELQTQQSDSAFQGLIENDLAAIALVSGDERAARAGFTAALEFDRECLLAASNQARLETALARWSNGEPSGCEARRTSQQTTADSNACRVALVSLLFSWPTAGGGNVHTVEMARFLAKAGYNVRHFYAQYEPWSIGRVQGVTPFPSEAISFEDAEWNAASIQRKFRSAIDEFDPDYVIISDSWNFKPLLAEAVRGYPFLLRLQALECLCPLNNVRLLPHGAQCPKHQLATPDACRRCVAENFEWSGSLHRAERALCGVGTPEYDRVLRWAFAEAEAVLVVNPLCDAMVSPYARQVRVVPSGFDPERFPWPWPAHEAPVPKTKVSLFIAAVVQEGLKGYPIAHEACARLWQRRQDFELVATGDPPGRVDEFTRYVGWLTQEELPRHMREADVILVPAIAQEALGRTAVEGMGVGRPVIASRIGGLPYTIADGAGLLVEAGDPEDLASKIEYLLDHPAQREQMGLAGRRRFEEHFTWPQMIERHYRPLLNQRRDRRQTSTFVPVFPSTIDERQLCAEGAELVGIPAGTVAAKLRAFLDFYEMQGYCDSLGELKTLCCEEAFVLWLMLEAVRPRTVVEIGTYEGRSARRIFDMLQALGLNARLVCVDVADDLRFVTHDEVKLLVRDVTGAFRTEILEALAPELIFLDVHMYRLLDEALAETMRSRPNCVLAIHDCGRGLCNPRMPLEPDDFQVSSSTGVWERHLLAKHFNCADPLDAALDCIESATHRLRIFDTRHGLGVIVPRRFESLSTATTEGPGRRQLASV